MRFSNPVFVSGHTRSGTNLLMRLIDGTPEITVPPGEGKLNVLRRLHGLSYPLAGSAAEVAETIWSNIELNLDAARETAFRGVLREQLAAATGARGFMDTVSDLLSAVSRFVDPTGAVPTACWMEKNHNLEFYWNRARFYFGKPKLLFVLRNPFDNWVSWREYMASNALGSSPEIFARLMQQHVANEVAEMALGRSRFATAAEVAANYDPARMTGSDTPEGRFAWNYRLMYERAMTLRGWSPDVHVVRYEDIVLDTASAMRGVMAFLQCEWSNVHLTPTDHGITWDGNSSFMSAAGIVDPRTVGRGHRSLAPDEVERMRAVLAEVPGADLQLAATLT